MTQPIQLFLGAETAPVRAKAGALASPRDGFATAMDRSARRQEPARSAERRPGRAEAQPSSEGSSRDAQKPDETVAQPPAADQAAQPGVEATIPAQPSLHDPLVMLPGLVQVTPAVPVPPVQLAQAPAVVGATPPAAAPVMAPVMAAVTAPVAPARPPVAEAVPNPLAAATVAAQAASEAVDPPAAEALPEEAPEGEEPATGEQKPRVPVSPVARQHVPESLETVKATMSLTAHDAPLNRKHQEAAARATAQAPIATESKPVAAEAVTEALETRNVPAAPAASAQAGPAPEAAVQPWELHHPVQAAEAAVPQARVLDGDAPRAEAMPMREALKTSFEQAAREPGKPTELRLQLSPEHLGRMQIRVVSHQGTLSASIRVEQSATRDMMQVQMAELRQTLADQGIKIDRLEVSVGQDQRRPEQGFDLSGGYQQQSQQQSQEDAQASGRPRALGFDDAGEPVAEMTPEEAAGEAPAVAASIDYQA